MNAVVARARRELRSRLGAWLSLALVAGVGAGAVLTIAAGARRTNSAYPRFNRAAKAADIVVQPAFDPNFANLSYDDVKRLPQVLVAARTELLPTTEQSALFTGAPPNGTEIDRLKILHGRAPRATDEAAVSFTVAKQRHLRVGSRLTVRVLTGPDGTGEPLPITLHVVGIEAAPGEFPPQIGDNFGGPVHVPLSTLTSRAGQLFTFEGTLVRLRHGAADIPAFTAALHRLAGSKPILTEIRAEQAADVQRSIHLQAVALWLLAGLLGLVTVAVLNQLLSRLAFVESGEHPALRALGMTRPQLWALGMARAVAIGLVAAIVGTALAVVLSPLMPIGTARTAEPHPGLSVDVLVLGLGALATVVLLVGVSAWPLWRISTRRPEEPAARPPLLARAAAAANLPPTVDAGVRLAVEAGRGRTAVPVRSSLVAVGIAVASLGAALTFAGSLNHLLDTPRLYGWNWDAHVSTGGANTADDAVKLLAAESRVTDIAVEDTPPLAIDRTEFDGVVLDEAKGDIEPVMLEGRPPRGPNEVVLGTETMRKVHARVGSTVDIRITAISAPPQPFEVVGRAVMAPRSPTSRLGAGGVLTRSGEKRMIPPDVTPPPPSDLDLRVAPGLDQARTVADIRRRLGDTFEVTGAERPTDLVNFGRVQNLPLVMSGLLAILGAATLAHTLLTSIRRRRRDLSILKTLGFSSRQVRWTVSWQATTFAIVALAIGLPVGTAAGRALWSTFANHLGAVSEPVTPLLALSVTVPGAVLVANVVAAVPAAFAGRMHPAVALRTE